MNLPVNRVQEQRAWKIGKLKYDTPETPCHFRVAWLNGVGEWVRLSD